MTRMNWVGRALGTLLSLSLIIGCDSANSPNTPSSLSRDLRLAGGTAVADPFASPQIVKLTYHFEDGAPGLCSGVVIAPQWVLTAAHCILGAVGQMNIEGVYGSLPVVEAIVHPGYFVDSVVGAIFNDVALVRPELPAEIAALPQLGILASLPVVEKAELGAWGYGLTPEGEVGNLQTAPASVSLVTPNHIFSEGLCAGDSGGPLVAQAVLNPLTPETIYGVVGLGSSGFTEGCAQGDVALYTNLQNPALLEFIAAHAPGVIMY